MKKSNRKGFTIVELVIVIAVIAILAAVLIPTFTNLVKKANLSADQQAVRQMNTILAAEGAVKKNNIFEVYDALAESGFDAENYKPLTKGVTFEWDPELDRVLLVEGDVAIYPAEYKDLTREGRGWVNLDLANALIPTKPADFAADSTTVTVNTAQEYAYVVQELNAGHISAASLTIDLNGKVLDMQGGNVTLANKPKGVLDMSVTIKNGTIKNIVSVDAAYAASENIEGMDGLYNCSGLFGSIQGKAKVSVENVTIENVSIRNTNVSGAGIIAASIAGEASLTIKNVTIKNSTIIAHRNEGALVGFVNAANGLILLGDISLENVSVLTVGGRSGLLVGLMAYDFVSEITDENNEVEKLNGIHLTDCHYEIYNCKQNTGIFEGQVLGFDSNTRTLYSYAYNASSKKDTLENKKFFAGAKATASNQESMYTNFDSFIK